MCLSIFFYSSRDSVGMADSQLPDGQAKRTGTVNGKSLRNVVFSVTEHQQSSLHFRRCQSVLSLGVPLPLDDLRD